MRLRAVIVDEWAVLRSGVGAVLDQYGVEVVAQTADLPAAARLVGRATVDLVLLGSLTDIAPGLALRAIRSANPAVTVVMMLATPARRTALDLLDDGAAAVVSREVSETDLRDAVMRALRGERHLGAAMLHDDRVDAFDDRAEDVLTERERAVLRELAAGHSNRQIADALFIGEATVKTHLHKIYGKLEVANRVQAIGRARERGLLAG